MRFKMPHTDYDPNALIARAREEVPHSLKGQRSPGYRYPEKDARTALVMRAQDAIAVGLCLQSWESVAEALALLERVTNHRPLD